MEKLAELFDEEPHQARNAQVRRAV
jgi:hypothetical protein